MSKFPPFIKPLIEAGAKVLENIYKSNSSYSGHAYFEYFPNLDNMSLASTLASLKVFTKWLDASLEYREIIQKRYRVDLWYLF